MTKEQFTEKANQLFKYSRDAVKDADLKRAELYIRLLQAEVTNDLALANQQIAASLQNQHVMVSGDLRTH